MSEVILWQMANPLLQYHLFNNPPLLQWLEMTPEQQLNSLMTQQLFPPLRFAPLITLADTEMSKHACIWT